MATADLESRECLLVDVGCDVGEFTPLLGSAGLHRVSKLHCVLSIPTEVPSISELCRALL